MVFDSGWEWGYWLSDVITARASWNPLMEIEDENKAWATLLQPFTNMLPKGLPWPVYILLVPIEYLSTFIIAPFTHAVRLFANMFAGHTILAFFSLVGFWFLFEKPTVAGFGVGIIGVIVTILMTTLELLIQFLQAFLFALLAAMYIQSGLEADH